MLKKIKKELLIYLAILVCMSLFMHPERITLIENPMQLGHAFLWSFGVYLIILIVRKIFMFLYGFFNKKEN